MPTGNEVDSPKEMMTMKLSPEFIARGEAYTAAQEDIEKAQELMDEAAILIGRAANRLIGKTKRRADLLHIARQIDILLAETYIA